MEKERQWPVTVLTQHTVLPSIEKALCHLWPNREMVETSQKPHEPDCPRVTSQKGRKKPTTFTLYLFFNLNTRQVRTGWTLRLMNMRHKCGAWGVRSGGFGGGTRNTTLIFRIPWFCYSARLSNDQLFGLRQAFLRSLSLIIAIEYERRCSLHSSTKENPCL